MAARARSKALFSTARVAVASLAFVTWQGLAFAQPATPSARDKTEATAKFREGEVAFARGDYRAAALAFESSYRLASHPNTLVNAIESWEKVGNALFAARQCIRLRKDFPGGRDAELALEKIERLSPRIAQLEIQASGVAKNLTIDAAPADVGLNIVEPGEHVVTAELDGKPIEQKVRVGLGGKLALKLAHAQATASTPPPPPPPPTPAPPDDGLPTPLHLAFFTSAATLTVASGALLVWSGLDARSAYEDFKANPTERALDDGRSRETRTNALIGTTAGLGAVSVALAVFTDWDGSFASKSAALHLAPTFATLELALP